MKKDQDNIKHHVREGYGKIARQGSSCCSSSSCCGGGSAKNISKTVGYTEGEMDVVPEGANLGLGCGNPVAIASLKEGETVLDLGSGAGFDAFLASGRVGEKGWVIGVDMTQEMLQRARQNALKGNYRNVEFRLGEIEHLPVDSNTVDVIISNCVINLSPDKQSVFKEAFRVLKSGGRLMVSDLVLIKELPKAVKESIEAYVGCLAGAVKRDDYLVFIKDAGFEDVKVVSQASYPIEAMANDATAKAIMEKASLTDGDVSDIANSVVSVKVHAVKSVE
ncbi:MAG: arsenite methyltransferase [Candidatus Omnitrophica bacterium]|nr:arsenite methyltransferase [Candidatus Omnitrophota bacterium]